MALFGKKKEETKKELEDIQQIKEMINPIEVPPVTESSPQDWATQQLLIGNVPKVGALQTPNVPKTTWTATAAPQKQLEIPESAPLFIKLDRYKNILHTISDLRNIVTKVKNAFEMFSEMERVKAENLRVLEAAIQKVEARIVDLDSEFLRPAGLSQTQQQENLQYEQQQEDNGLHGMIEDLRGQIDKLKEELNQIGSEQEETTDEFNEV